MYWITRNLGTAAYGEPELEKLKNTKFVNVRDLIDGAGNDPEIFKFKVSQVEKIISKGKKAVVVCGSGISRSNAVALAYLIWKGMEFDDAYNLIRKKVPITQIEMDLLDLAKKMRVYYPTVEDITSTNREIVLRDIEAIKRELKKGGLTNEERDFLKRLLAKKQGKCKNMEECIAIEKEGEIWFERKDKNFELDYDVLTD